MSKGKKIQTIVIILCVSLLIPAGFLFVGYRQAANALTAQRENTVYFPQYFEGTDFDGNPVVADVLKGHELTFVNIWATDCGPCVGEMPDLNELSLEMPEVQFIGLCIGSLSSSDIDLLRPEALQIVADTGVTYLCMFPSDSFAKNFINKNVHNFPTTYVLNANGEVIDFMVGSQDKAQWKNYLEQKLDEQKEVQ